MYPNFYYAFRDLFGIESDFLRPINSFGFFVALAFAAAVIIFTRRLKAMEQLNLIQPQKRTVVEGKINYLDILVNALVGFVLGFKIVYSFQNQELFNHYRDFIVSSEGNLTYGILGAIVFVSFSWIKHNKNKLSEPITKEADYHSYNHIGAILIIAAVAGILGSKLFAYLEDPGPISELFSDPFSGMTIYGGLIGGVGCNLLYIHFQRLPKLLFLDAGGPALILAYGVGRIGCHVSGDGDWGITNLAEKPSWLSFIPDWLWAYDYPNNVAREGNFIPGCVGEYCQILENPAFPTPLYETLMCLVIFVVLIRFGNKFISIPGLTFSLYLLLNGIERFSIETIRVNVPYQIFGIEITQAQIIALCLIALGSFMLWYCWQNKYSHLRTT